VTFIGLSALVGQRKRTRTKTDAYGAARTRRSRRERFFRFNILFDPMILSCRIEVISWCPGRRIQAFVCSRASNAMNMIIQRRRCAQPYSGADKRLNTTAQAPGK